MNTQQIETARAALDSASDSYFELLEAFENHATDGEALDVEEQCSALELAYATFRAAIGAPIE